MIDLPETANITLEVHPAREATKNVSLVVGGSSTYEALASLLSSCGKVSQFSARTFVS